MVEHLMDVMANNDAPKTDQALMAESLQKEIERSLSTLTDKEREIIRSIFWDRNESWTNS